jgi:hypothetical protein
MIPFNACWKKEDVLKSDVIFRQFIVYAHSISAVDYGIFRSP